MIRSGYSRSICDFDIIFIKNEEDIEKLSSLSDILSIKSKIIPLLPKTAIKLADNNLLANPLPIDYLHQSEREKIREDAIELSKNWYQNLNTEYVYEGVNLFECCRIQIMGFFQDVLTAELVAPRIIASFQPKKVLFLNYPRTATVGHSNHDGSSDVFLASLIWQFQLSEIEVKIQSFFVEKAKDLVGQIITYPKRKIPTLSLYQKLKSHLRKGKPHRFNSINIKDTIQSKKLIIGYGEGYDILIIWPYINEIAKTINGFPVIVSGSGLPEKDTLRSGLNNDDNIPLYDIQEISLAETPVFNISDIEKRLLYPEKYDLALPQSIKNPLLHFQFSHLCEVLFPQVIATTKTAHSFFKNNHIALYLDDYAAGHIQRTWVSVASQYNVPTVSVAHGAINLIEFQDYLSDWAFAWGELEKTNLELASPLKKDSIIISGDPSMNRLGDRITQTVNPELCNKKILILTSGYLHQGWTDINLQDFLLTWEHLAEYVKKRSDIQFIIKPHPSVRDLGPWYKEYIERKSLQKYMAVIDSRKLEDLLPESYFAVLFGKPGTAGLVCAMADVPFVYFDVTLCRDVPGYRIWSDENGVPKIRSCEELFRLIESIERNKNEYCRIHQQNKKFLSRYLSQFDAEKICNKLKIL